MGGNEVYMAYLLYAISEFPYNNSKYQRSKKLIFLIVSFIILNIVYSFIIFVN